MAAGDAQVNLVGELSGQELPLGDPNQVIGPAGLSAGSRGNNDRGNVWVAAHPQPFPESPQFFDALQSVGHFLFTLQFPRPLCPESFYSSYQPMGAWQHAPSISNAIRATRRVAPTLCAHSIHNPESAIVIFHIPDIALNPFSIRNPHSEICN
jgi:hypothetical protein